MLIESQNYTTNSKYPFSQERRVACGIILNKNRKKKSLSKSTIQTNGSLLPSSRELRNTQH